MAKIKKIEFKQIPIPTIFGRAINNIYFIVENNRSKVMDNFRRLENIEKELIKDLIIKMATIENFRSPKIKYQLKGYKYGEIRPMPHRFFFFQKCGKNIVFFEYTPKKKRALNDSFYKQLNRKKENYEKEFQKFIQRH